MVQAVKECSLFRSQPYGRLLFNLGMMQFILLHTKFQNYMQKVLLDYWSTIYQVYLSDKRNAKTRSFVDSYFQLLFAVNFNSTSSNP
jgi:hypothetical protein